MTRIVYVMLLLYVVCSYNHVSCTIIVVRHMWTIIISLKHVYVMYIFQTLVLLFHTVLWPSVYVLIKTYISHCGVGLELIYAKETIMNNVHVLIHQHVIFLPKKGKSIKGREFEPLTGSICFFEQEPLPSVLRTGCFQERIRAWFT